MKFLACASWSNTWSLLHAHCIHGSFGLDDCLDMSPTRPGRRHASFDLVSTWPQIRSANLGIEISPAKKHGYGSTFKPPDRRLWSMLPLTRVPFGVPIFDPQPHGKQGKQGFNRPGCGDCADLVIRGACWDNAIPPKALRRSVSAQRTASQYNKCLTSGDQKMCRILAKGLITLIPPATLKKLPQVLPFQRLQDDGLCHAANLRSAVLVRDRPHLHHIHILIQGWHLEPI